MPPMKKVEKEEYDRLLNLLDRVDPYIERPSLGKPWYNCICASNVAAEPNAMTISELPLYMVFDILEKYYGNGITFVGHSSRRAGYIPQGQVMIILPYRGRWGAGWILATHYSATTVTCKYCLLVDGGLNHGSKETDSSAESTTC